MTDGYKHGNGNSNGGACSTDSILSIESVTRRFGGITAVSNVSTEVPRGAIASMIGPNGAGKTTLFNSITGVIPPTSGLIVLRRPSGNVDITKLRPDQVCRLGVARTFQNIRLFSELNALENVKIGFHSVARGRLMGALLPLRGSLVEERALDQAARDCLEFVGLGEVCAAAAGALSYGDQRRLEIARALASSPMLLLLDEPAAGMNASETVELMALIRKIRDAGITVFLIEHDMKLVMNISDRICVLDHGEKIAEGCPAEIAKDPKVIEAYLGSGAVCK